MELEPRVPGMGVGKVLGCSGRDSRRGPVPCGCPVAGGRGCVPYSSSFGASPPRNIQVQLSWGNGCGRWGKTLLNA